MSNEQEPAQVDAPKEPEVKYVLSGQPTGWWAAAKDVREFDVEKVQSCKEDIDTLLVFVGLFSAALSAFLVAVYPNLQQQPSDRIVYAIERVAAQTAGYRVNLTDGTLIAANILPPSPPSFQVSDNDIRVNVLWFASLIISLVTASFGMLVKQWLREFLAGEGPSALHRLRLRHFREPQMKAWMVPVYEIAGLLPILLHLSLGLFFVGLCYFTSSVHSSIGHTTIPLVAGWALCFFAATALPIFFPRCPYKVAFLKVLIVRLHRLVRGFAKWLYPRADERDSEGNPSSEDDSRNGDEDADQFFLAGARRATVHIWEKYRNYMKSLFRTAVTAAQKISDEAILVQHPTFDLDILSSVDAIQGNDEMLATTIPEALLYTRPDSSDVVQLVIELLEHRVPTLEPSQRVVEYWPFHDMAPWNHLKPQARDYILSILLGHIEGLYVVGDCHLTGCSLSHGEVCRDHITLFRALFLIASAPRELIRPSAVVYLKRYFEVAIDCSGFWRWLCYSRAATDARPELDRSLTVISAINDLTNTGQIQLSLEHRLGYSSEVPHPYFVDFVNLQVGFIAYPWDVWQLEERFKSSKLKRSCMVFWFDAVSEGLNNMHPQSDSLVTSVVGFSLRQFHSWAKETISFCRPEDPLVETDYKLVYDSFRKMAHIAVKRKDTALVFMNALFDEFQPPPRFEHSMPLIGTSTLLYTLRSYTPTINNRDQSQQDPTVIQAILQLVTSKMAEYQKPEHGITRQLELCQVLAFFLITIYVPPDPREECRRMFSSLATSLLVSHSQASSGMRDRPRMLARGCLDIMDHEDRVFGKSHSPCSEEDSIFPDTLLDILQTLSGKKYRHMPRRIPKTQPAGEPCPNSPSVTDSASTFDAESDVVSSLSEGEPQPGYAMQDAEQTTMAAHEEEEEEGNNV